MKNTPLLNERALHPTPTYSGVIHTILHLILQHVHYTGTHCDLRACVRARVRFRRSSYCVPQVCIRAHSSRSLVQGFIHHARASHRCMTFARTTAWRVTTRHTMTLIHGVATCTIAQLVCTRARRPTAKGKSGGGDRGEREERENRLEAG